MEFFGQIGRGKMVCSDPVGAYSEVQSARAVENRADLSS